MEKDQKHSKHQVEGKVDLNQQKVTSFTQKRHFKQHNPKIIMKGMANTIL